MINTLHELSPIISTIFLMAAGFCFLLRAISCNINNKHESDIESMKCRHEAEISRLKDEIKRQKMLQDWNEVIPGAFTLAHNGLEIEGIFTKINP